MMGRVDHTRDNGEVPTGWNLLTGFHSLLPLLNTPIPIGLMMPISIRWLPASAQADLCSRGDVDRVDTRAETTRFATRTPDGSGCAAPATPPGYSAWWVSKVHQSRVDIPARSRCSTHLTSSSQEGALIFVPFPPAGGAGVFRSSEALFCWLPGEAPEPSGADPTSPRHGVCASGDRGESISGRHAFQSEQKKVMGSSLPARLPGGWLSSPRLGEQLEALLDVTGFTRATRRLGLDLFCGRVPKVIVYPDRSPDRTLPRAHRLQNDSVFRHSTQECPASPPAPFTRLRQRQAKITHPSRGDNAGGVIRGQRIPGGRIPLVGE